MGFICIQYRLFRNVKEPVSYCVRVYTDMSFHLSHMVMRIALTAQNSHICGQTRCCPQMSAQTWSNGVRQTPHFITEIEIKRAV